MGVFRQFPYSNFHEMNMDEIIKIIKNMLEEWATYHAEWDEWMDQMEDDWSNYQDVMNTAWRNMQDFINNYFDNLDVQEEINNKIVSMIRTGEFGQLVNEYIPPAVSAWLALNITQPTGVVIDTSLTVAGACADAKATGNAVNELNTYIGYIKNDVWTGTDITTTTGTPDARLCSDGTIPSSGVYDITNMIDLTHTEYFSLDYSLTPTPGYDTIVIGYFNNLEISANSLIGYEETCKANKVYKKPNGALYVACTCLADTHPTITLYSDNIENLNNKVTEIKTELSDENVFTSTTWASNSRLDQSGNIVSSSIYDITNPIPVDIGKEYSLDYSLAISAGYAVVGYFSSDYIVGANMLGFETVIVANEKYNIPVGTKYIVLTCPTGTHPEVTFYSSRLDVIENKINNITNDFVRGTVARSDEMTADDSLTGVVGNLKKNTVLGFSANITTAGSLQIGQGKTANAETAYLIIDESSVKVYSYYNSEAHLEESYNHGLTIADYIDISIEESNTVMGTAKINITSNGDTYTINSVKWTGYNKNIYADVISGRFTNCLLSFYCADYIKDYWLFGDSYFDHWVPKCLEDGYSNFLCDGFSGRNSQQAFDALEQDLTHGKPNSIVWCIGMNDGDSVNAINSSWLTYFTKLKHLCDTNNINLVLCTIPNVPSVNNNYKNAAIRTSGYRYLDLAKAVGSDISNSWYSGLLSSDNIHPSILGDKMIARFFESSLPEIMK